MSRPVLLFSGPWSDLPLEELTARAADWGYQGLELACWGDHLEVQRAASETGYCAARLDLLARHDLHLRAIANPSVGPAVSGPVDERRQRLLPDYVCGDAQTHGMRQQRAQGV